VRANRDKVEASRARGKDKDRARGKDKDRAAGKDKDRAAGKAVRAEDAWTAAASVLREVEMPVRDLEPWRLEISVKHAVKFKSAFGKQSTSSAFCRRRS
jgi:hypothetical protein